MARQSALGQHRLIVLLNLALITALQFSLTILRARDYTPRLFRVARVLQIVALIAIALSPVLDYAVLVRPVTFLILVVGVLHDRAGHRSAWWRARRPARFYVIAWGAFLAGSVVFLLKNFGLVPHTFFTQHSWQVGALLEMILLSMTLSSRMNELKHQSRTDSLTLLGNRREFDVMLPVEFARAREEDRAAVVAGASTSTSSSSTTTFTATRRATRRSRPWRRLCASTRASRLSPVATAAMSSAPSCPAPMKHRRRSSPSACVPQCKTP